MENYSVKVKIKKFRKKVWEHYKKHGRHDLPWRQTRDPYKILVSEIMLQQTQVPRVLGKYKSFLKKFPTVKKLAKATFAEVLKEWSGLGYNRRAKYLYETAKLLSKKRKISSADYEKLPGVGPYTKNAVRVFAFNEPHILIETNIRTAYIHHLFAHPRLSTYRQKDVYKQIRDEAILPFAKKAAEGQDPRTWHWALMDYGAHLKRSGVRNNHRSAHYTKQSKFEGSLRQVRGVILRVLHEGPLTEFAVRRRLEASPLYIDRALEGLAKDRLIKKSAQGRKWRIA